MDYNKIVARLSGRRLCPQCGSLYSLSANAPVVAQLCDYDGAALMVREDDREEVIRQRLETYERQTMPLIEHFRSAGVPFHEVDATEGMPAAILKKINALLPATEATAIGSAVE